MCGVVGVCLATRQPVDPGLVGRALDAIAHRGPDGRGVWSGPGTMLGHLRLSILDTTEAAAQPMITPDGRYVVVFNGEIYNFKSLRDELAHHGVHVTSTGDTAVLLGCLATFGYERTLPRLDGDFAIALWDIHNETLVLARDVHGIKPLYFSRTPEGGVCFASEPKALFGAGAVAEPDFAAVNAALLGYSVTYGERTMFRGVFQVRPGEQLVFRRSDASVHRRQFASITDWVDDGLYRELNRASQHEVVDRVERAVAGGVRSRMISDVPVACLASGGVDSSLLSTYAARESPDIPLYHADVVSDSERPAAESLAGALGLRLHTVRVTDADIVAAIPAVTWYNDLPAIYHLNAVPFFLVSKLAARDGIKVLLSGEGSDEYFIGYPEMALASMLRTVSRLKAVPRGFMRAISPKATQLLWPNPGESFPSYLADLNSGFEAKLVTAQSATALGGGSARRDEVARLTTLELAQQHLVSLLHRNDRLGMAWGLEARFPMLTPEFAKLAINLPARYKLRHTPRIYDRRHPFLVDKWAVRQVAARELPSSLSARPKRGFPVSTSERLTVEPGLFTDGFVADLYHLDRRAISAMLDEGSNSWRTRLILLEVWGQLFFGGMDLETTQAHLFRHVRLDGEPVRRAAAATAAQVVAA